MSSASSGCLGKCFGSKNGRRVDGYVVVLSWAIMQSPLEFLIETGSRASHGVSSTDSGILSGW